MKNELHKLIAKWKVDAGAYPYDSGPYRLRICGEELQDILDAEPRYPAFLKAFCGLLMCSDPWSLDAESRIVIEGVADAMSREQGFDNWIEAYHAKEPVQ